MKQFAPLAVVLALAAQPVVAQDKSEGFNLMEEGARLFFKGIMQEMEPALKELEGMAQDMQPALEDFARNMGPALKDLLAEVEDWSVYEAPEMLPNGDIILRRKQPKTPETPENPDEIEL
ncbi:hypothetical protein VK792_18340 [Mesobacterium sp. TK19101]|uniref:AAA+ family ATPase n=1 Tax=Mesobacterium hydrothermale TaxID=3111907 RepID=A0ABU6HN28_9RHOB|nr:hypothetical protein [Mesobacterium sp. TK19101]MEC3863256.1 hypothetical protein [Mesobacterium sp. TK19101]